MNRTDSYGRAALFFALICLPPFLFPFIKGLSPFWGDLTYLQHPWRLFDSQELMAGRLPLWNPYLYFGMPQAAAMQDGLYYPASVIFYFFKFPAALFLFHILHYWLACFLCYLWTRSLGFSHSSSLCAGLIWGLSGIAISREPFLNHLSSFSLIPGSFLFLDIPIFFALTLSAIFFAGYPPFLAGAIFSSLLLAWMTRRKPALASFYLLAGCALSLGFSAALLLPASELFRHSVRALGIAQAEAFQFDLRPFDLLQWISPVLSGLNRFNPAVNWWTCLYLGFSGFFLILMGLFKMPFKKRIIWLLWMSSLLILSLAGANALSSYLWLRLPFLKFIRYPGNISYLILVPATLAAALGAQKIMGISKIPASLPVVFLAAELSFYAFNAFPLEPFSFFSYKGPLIEFLQKNLGTNRYLLSPLALEKSSGQGIYDWKSRLYGLTNSPFELAAAGNFGQPLVPADNYALMDFLYGSNGLQNAKKIMPWADIRHLLTPSKIPQTRSLKYRGLLIWQMYETTPSKNLGRAYFLSPQAGRSFPAGLAIPNPDIALEPLKVENLKDASGYRISGNGRPGWVFLSEARYPGWKGYLKVAQETKPIASQPALKAFQKMEVPQGWSALFLIYDSDTVWWGIFISVFSFIFLFFYAVTKMRELRH